MPAILKTIAKALGAALILTGALAAPALAGVDDIWRAHDPASTITLDHRPWDRFLARYVRLDAAGIARVAYRRVSAADRAELARYITALEKAPVHALRRDQQFAYWVNLYNAATVRLILDHYPIHSIRRIGLFSGPWRRKLVTVEGRKLSLDDIENRILRPLWRDPRVHYALNCASVGCPNLAGKAWRAATRDAMLDAAARAYINNPRGVTVEKGRLVGSKIYQWYGKDFGNVLDHLKAYARPALAARLASFAKIDRYRYDWTLNDDGQE